MDTLRQKQQKTMYLVFPV